VGDDKGCIRYYLAGFPGSSHDNRVWKWSRLYRNKEDFFSAIEYLLGDTAYEPDEVVVSAFKADDTEGNIADPMKHKFNEIIKRPRLTMEHINGWAKGRFPGALRKLRLIITEEKESLLKILEYIDCAIILYNLLLSIGDGKEDEDDWGSEELSRMDDPHRGDPDNEDHKVGRIQIHHHRFGKRTNLHFCPD